MGSLQPFNLSDIIKVTMKQSVYDYSFEMRRARNHRLGITFGLIVSVVFFITMFLNFILFPVLVRSDSMDSDIPKNSAVFVTPLDRNPERGDVVYLSRLDDEKLGAGQVVINKLFKHTQLQVGFGVIMLALVDGVPRVLSLKEVLHYYIKHQEEVIERRTRYELSKFYRIPIISPLQADAMKNGNSNGLTPQITIKEMAKTPRILCSATHFSSS